MAALISLIHLSAAGVLFHAIRSGREYEERIIHLSLVALAGVLGMVNFFIGGGGH